ncbi:MAG: universal stress protein [Desulfomonilaceae bacterium]|nr:universal stress protein [Desulfomonilaceae bacterium]
MLPKKILCCTDFSENSEQALETALEYANALDAHLVITHVVDSWAGYPAYSEGIPMDVRNVVRDLEDMAKEKLQKKVEELRGKIDKVSTLSRVGVPAEDIIAAAKDESADLIVMGTRGWTGLRHILLGSVAERVLRGAHCPVLIVRS